MRFWSKILLLIVISHAVSCGEEQKPASPRKTFETYTKAIDQGDTTTMKLLLSDETIKMHEEQAKAQGVTLDEIVKRETLFTKGQKTVVLRNEKIEGERATLEVKNSFGAWETIPFVLDDNEWKIDKKGAADRLLQEIQQGDQELDRIINQGKQP